MSTEMTQAPVLDNPFKPRDMFESLSKKANQLAERFVATREWKQFSDALEAGHIDQIDGLYRKIAAKYPEDNVARTWAAVAVMVPAQDPSDPRHAEARTWLNRNHPLSSDVGMLMNRMIKMRVKPRPSGRGRKARAPQVPLAM